jgi:hypothetical protein
MTPAQKHRDKVARRPSEGGYTGVIKSARGVKMKDPHLWKREEQVLGKGKEREKEIFQVIGKARRETNRK